MIFNKKQKSTEITKNDIEHLSEKLLQKNLHMNNAIFEQQQKNDKASLKAKIKRNKQAKKIIKKSL